MCGIAGFVSFNEDFLSAEERLEMVSEMTNAQTHRGPDDEGLWQDRQATLGHRRLAVIDLTASGRQPMSAEVEVGPTYRDWETDRKSTRLNSSHSAKSRMSSSA